MSQTHTVLIVDDDAQIRKALTRSLRDEPYTVIDAESGPKAMVLLAKKRVQVVLSDLNMPEMDGIALLSRIAEQYPNIIRLVLSGQTEANKILNAINAGSIYRYIVKPWDDELLKIVLRQAMALWDLQAERDMLVTALQKDNEKLEELVAKRANQILAVQRQADLGRHASQIVHNLSNPLNAVTASLELLSTYLDNDPIKKEKIEKGVAIARTAANDLKEIIVRILSHAREEDQFELVSLDVNTAIEKQIAFFDLIPEFKYKLQKELHLDKAIPLVHGNPVHIEKILDNLIKNAMDAMEGVVGKKLTIETSMQGKDVLIRVSDTGHGITEKNMARLFLSDFTTKPVGKGAGLGLASVKSMVEAYRGTIHVTSTPGQGSTFCIRLPALACESHPLKR